MPATKLKERRDVPSSGGYETDFYSWALGQAEALRARRLADFDIENLAEEIEDLGRETFNKLTGSFRVNLIHLLKWDHKPERRSRSWAGSIDTHRLEIENVLADNPSLRGRQAEAVARAYRQARIRAAVEMKRDKSSLPVECPYTLGDITERAIHWPGC